MTATDAALNDLAPNPAPLLNVNGKAKDGGGSAASLPQTLFVLDTTAVDASDIAEENRTKGLGARTHHMIVGGITRAFTFQPHKPLSLPLEIAIKFLKIPSFRCTDDQGNPLAYRRQPKQPDELGAGEKFVLADHQTVADFSELTNMALFQRALELPGGERFKPTEANDPPNRAALIEFIVSTKVALRKANTEKAALARAKTATQRVAAAESEEFLPEAEPDDGPRHDVYAELENDD